MLRQKQLEKLQQQQILDNQNFQINKAQVLKKILRSQGKYSKLIIIQKKMKFPKLL